MIGTLLNEVKAYLKITWDEEDIEINSLIKRGIGYLSNLAGTTPDFNEDGLPKQLLLDFCRYVRNNSFEYFQENFKSDLTMFIFNEAIRTMPEEGETDA